MLLAVPVSIALEFLGEWVDFLILPLIPAEKDDKDERRKDE